jgi:hypothetical protein
MKFSEFGYLFSSPEKTSSVDMMSLLNPVTRATPIDIVEKLIISPG